MARYSAFKRSFKKSLMLVGFFTLICGVIYPLSITAIAQVLFPHAANGSLIENEEGKIVGSRLIGQAFTSEKYFHGRPSMTEPAYNPLLSAASNMGPGSKGLQRMVQGRIEALQEKQSTEAVVLLPADLVMASASGLDPHISPEAAAYQVERVARVNKLDMEEVKALIDQHTDGKQFALFGQARVNVLELNIALSHFVKEKYKGEE